MTLMLAAAVALAQTLTQKIDVSVVNVDVVVRARDGSPLRGLTRDDFQLFEDGVPSPSPTTSDKGKVHDTLAAIRGAGTHSGAADVVRTDERPREIQSASLAAMNRDRGLA